MSLIIKFSLKLSKNKSKRKRNFIIYHFLVESKSHKRLDLLIIANVNIYQTKKKKYSNSNENMLFCRKTDETVWKPPLSKRTLPISVQFFHDPPLCPKIPKNSTK